MSEPAVKVPLVHAGSSGSKWHLGKTLCNKPASWRTPLSADPAKVTCKCCQRRLQEKLAREQAQQLPQTPTPAEDDSLDLQVGIEFGIFQQGDCGYDVEDNS